MQGCCSHHWERNSVWFYHRHKHTLVGSAAVQVTPFNAPFLDFASICNQSVAYPTVEADGRNAQYLLIATAIHNLTAPHYIHKRAY